MQYDYEQLLKNARSKIPEVVSKSKRLELPNVRSRVFGMRTLVFNLKEIAEAMNRDPHHLLKFMTKEMATAATLQESSARPRAIFQGKFDRNTFERLVQRYMRQYVVCPTCERPDSKIVKEKRLSFLVCEACGAKSSIRQL
ncbi:MAG: translation initiation factor IF-2 subunit beta [Candidatus Bathyarchaeota archaeon]|jgi:translation initiation factor 2 subunit 2